MGKAPARARPRSAPPPRTGASPRGRSDHPAPAAPRRVVLGVTGASGAVFAERFARRFVGEKFLIPTPWGEKVFASEMGKPLAALSPMVTRIFDAENLFSPFASGSVGFDALVILPCSVSTMAKIAHGISDNLLTRVAQVALKEKRPLIIGLRETPLSTIALRNALTLSEAGAVILPLCPAFYQHPRTIDDLIDPLISRICAFLGQPAAGGFRSEELE